MSVDEIYSRFIAWLDKGWWHLPASEHLLPSIKAFFTPFSRFPLPARS
jgi:hypothetical protein